MAKRAHIDDSVDPTRAKLAELASAPVVPQSAPADRDVYPASPVDERRDTTRRRSYLTVNRKVMISEDEADRYIGATHMISSAFGSRVTYSQVTRALWALTCGATAAIREKAHLSPKLPVPSKGNHVAMAEFEQALACFLGVVIERSLQNARPSEVGAQKRSTEFQDRQRAEPVQGTPGSLPAQ